MASVIAYIVLPFFLICCDCSPIKRSTNVQDDDCYGTECYYSDLDATTEIVLPDNLTEVVLVNLPLISRSQGEIVNILDNHMGGITALMANQVETQKQMVSLLNNITGSLATMITKHDRMDKLLDYHLTSLTILQVDGLKLKDCTEISHYSNISKPYRITPHGASRPYTLRCDLETDGGGWTVIQRRLDGSVDFYRDWHDYVDGFGDPYGEYWSGLEFIHILTKTGTWELRVDLEDFGGKSVHAHYSSFRVGNAASQYSLSLGTYSGTAGNGMIGDNNYQFSTRDNDNDGNSTKHCAVENKGAWWYSACSYANLNGKYVEHNQINGEGLTWFAWKSTFEVLKKSEMKLRRVASLTVFLADGGDCTDVGVHSSQSKLYKVKPYGASTFYTVRCDLETDGGGWTVIQRRFDGSVNFYRGWQDYVDGFGDPYGEYWAGLEFIHLLTTTGTWELRVDLEDFNGNTVYAQYTSFGVGDATSKYRLSVGTYSGTARNGMKFDYNNRFSTRDSDNDQRSDYHCAVFRKGGWWYGSSYANLNGMYLGPNQVSGEGLNWYAWRYTYEVLKKSEMKIRRI